MRSTLQTAISVPLETEEQQAFFAWAELWSTKVPELADLFAVPNGSNKSKAMAARFKREGLKAGVPDIILPHARGRYHALYIELKRRRAKGEKVELRAGTRPRADQLDWHRRLRAAGNAVEVAYGWEEARDIVLDYLGPPPYMGRPVR